ncbi:MAG: dihydrofolate reductase family protein [Ignavibacteria bacterium]|nr:dihydrofolate reductase family protein [Ignavibacteria bacterium]
MRTLKLQMQVSLDGFVAGANGEMDWMVWDWDDELKQYVKNITAPVDCIVLGRVLATGFIPTWEEQATNPETAEDFARTMNETPKVVFSKTLLESDWKRTALAKGDIVEEISRLKAQAGGDIIAYGGSSFVSALIQHGLIDEYHLFINPVALGSGIPIFTSLKSRLNLNLVRTESFSCGIVVLQYNASSLKPQ